MKILLQLLLLAASTLSVFSRQEIQITGAQITEVGIYQAKVLKASTNAVGIKLQELDDFKLINSTTNIPARIGIRFGFRYEILGTPSNAPITLEMVGKHPPIKNPVTGKEETQNIYQLNSWIGKTYTSYSLDNKSELMPGQWVFEVWHRGKKLCEQSFLVAPDKEKQEKQP